MREILKTQQKHIAREVKRYVSPRNDQECAAAIAAMRSHGLSTSVTYEWGVDRGP